MRERILNSLFSRKSKIHNVRIDRVLPVAVLINCLRRGLGRVYTRFSGIGRRERRQ